MKLHLAIPLMWVMTAGAFAAPQIEVDQPRWNFGTVTNGYAEDHDFLIRNRGDETLRISRVLSSCSACLSAQMPSTNLPPGGTATVRAHLDLRTLTGAVTRAILVDSNDPKTPSVILNLAGVVVPAYQVVPPEINLDLSRNQPAATVEISALTEGGGALAQVSSSDTNVIATITRRATSPGEYVVAMQVLNSLPRGNTVCVLTARGTDSNTEPCRVLCYIRNPPDLELTPVQLRLQPVDELQRRILWIRQRGPTPLILLDILASSATIKCEIVPESTRFNYRVNVAARGQKNHSGQTNWLTLKMQDQNLQERLVPVPVSVN
ncbi:MAG: DUF1573 domain-containing protein [Verrucomicrobiae bacterium]|nr:DUF1573 domain-containing protein [Verrucomicrobiae bacterium]